MKKFTSRNRRATFRRQRAAMAHKYLCIVLRNLVTGGLIRFPSLSADDYIVFANDPKREPRYYNLRFFNEGAS